MKKILSIYIKIIILSLVSFAYIAEFYLTINNYETIGDKEFHLRNLKKKKEIYKKNTGLDYDERPISEVFQQNNLENEKLSITMPAYYKTNFDFFYLSGISKIETLNCNENGYFSYSQSDRFGFNNEDEEWNKEEIEFVIVGDSFVFGNCVNRPNDIASIFRKLSNKSVLNLGYPGIGTLSEYAILKEYLPKKVKNIIWVFYDNDFDDLEIEIKNKKLYNYITSSNKLNNLKNNQPEIDIKLKNNIKKIIKSHEEYYLYWESYYSPKKKFLRFIRLNKLKSFYNNLLIDIKKQSNDFNEISLNTLKEFRTLAYLIKNLALENNSKLYFVYIADYKNYSSYLNRKFNIRNSKSIQKKMVDIVKGLNINVINIHEDFLRKEKDPIKYYPFRSGGHFNELGYKKVAEFIYKEINY